MRSAGRVRLGLPPLLLAACGADDAGLRFADFPPPPPLALSCGPAPTLGQREVLFADLDAGRSCRVFLEQDECALGIFDDCTTVDDARRDWFGTVEGDALRLRPTFSPPNARPPRTPEVCTSAPFAEAGPWPFDCDFTDHLGLLVEVPASDPPAIAVTDSRPFDPNGPIVAATLVSGAAEPSLVFALGPPDPRLVAWLPSTGDLVPMAPLPDAPTFLVAQGATVWVGLPAAIRRYDLAGALRAQGEFPFDAVGGAPADGDQLLVLTRQPTRLVRWNGTQATQTTDLETSGSPLGLVRLRADRFVLQTREALLLLHPDGGTLATLARRSDRPSGLAAFSDTEAVYFDRCRVGGPLCLFAAETGPGDAWTLTQASVPDFERVQWTPVGSHHLLVAGPNGRAALMIERDGWQVQLASQTELDVPNSALFGLPDGRLLWFSEPQRRVLSISAQLR
jgi:hypothetical protein